MRTTEQQLLIEIALVKIMMAKDWPGKISINIILILLMYTNYASIPCINNKDITRSEKLLNLIGPFTIFIIKCGYRDQKAVQ